MCWTVCCSRFIIQAVKWDYHSHDVSLQAVCLLSQKRSDNIPQKHYTCSKHAADVFYVCQQYFTSRTALSIQIRKMERENLHTSSQPNQPAHHRTAEPTTTQSAHNTWQTTRTRPTWERLYCYCECLTHKRVDLSNRWTFRQNTQY